MLERKTVPFLEAKADGDLDSPGIVSGYGSCWGGIDAVGDTVDAGAFKDTLSDFLKSGFIAHGHDWTDYVATVKSAHEDSKGLFIVGEYHSDPDAQKVRTRVAERIARGQTMGLSIGYEVQESEMRQVETPYRNRWGEWSDKVRALVKCKLYEVSLVTVPADPAALVSSAKGAPLPFDDHSESVRVAVSEWLARVKAGSAIREADLKVGRAISEARRTRMATVSGSLRDAAAEIDAMLKETEPEKEPKAAGVLAEPLRLRADFERMYARISREFGARA